MAEPAKRKANYEDLYNIPENMTGEIIDGDLIALPRPSRQHGYVAASLGSEILPAYHSGRKGGPGGWVILVEPEVKLGDNILVPDLAGWKRERFPLNEDHNWISIAPEWVCEILSPSTARIDKIRKMPIYGQHEVRHLWLIDPTAKTLEIYRLEMGAWMVAGLYAEDDKVRAEPFLEIEIDLGEVWME